MSNLTTFSQIESLFDSRAAFARAVGVSDDVARKWHERDRIPVEHWVSVVNACHEIDAPVTYKLLAELVQK